MLHIIEPAVTMLTTHTDTVRVLADIGSGDGTSNGSILKIVNRVCLAAGVIGVAVFAVAALRVQMEKDAAGKTKKLMEEAKVFGIFEGFVAVAWTLASLAANVFGGAAS
ncbi:MAG: hypothetical protein PHQ28_01395 [Mycobacterium sp.]|nr:hypothetical protein [Mycobacterium sp.]